MTFTVATPFIDLPVSARQHPESARIDTYTRELITRYRSGGDDAGAHALMHDRFGDAAAYRYPGRALPGAHTAGPPAIQLHGGGTPLPLAEYIGALAGVSAAVLTVVQDTSSARASSACQT